MIFKSDSAKGDLNGFLDAGSHIQGELHFDDTFRVDGKVTGRVVSKGDLVVGERGEITGEIEVGRVFVSGKVEGKIRTTRRTELTAGGRILADIETPSLVIEDGGFFKGRCIMAPAAAHAEAPRESVRAMVTPMPIPKEG
jgi:cytoskeletal protein CcmA (bactofilin family)